MPPQVVDRSLKQDKAGAVDAPVQEVAEDNEAVVVEEAELGKGTEAELKPRPNLRAASPV